jgi:hypothetical protein
MKELLDLMIPKYGNEKDRRIIEVGLQEGENKHENIDPNNTSQRG